MFGVSKVFSFRFWMNILINEYIQQQNNNLIKSDSKNVYNFWDFYFSINHEKHKNITLGNLGRKVLKIEKEWGQASSVYKGPH